ncbi:hypothetical protein Tco_0304673 [Tanacetum coccineum]
MRNKYDLDTLSIDDLYNNFKVYEAEIKGQSSSSSNSQNVAFVSSENTSSTNEAVNTAHEVSTIDTDDLEEMDLKCGDSCKMPLVVQDGIGGYDWSFQAKEGLTNFALMAYTSQGSSSSSSSDSEYDVQVKDISIKDLKNQLEEALKEKDDLKLKLEKFEESSKNLTKLINSQISAKDKAGLGYDSQMNKSEVVHSVFNSRESDVDDSPVNDRFKTVLRDSRQFPLPTTGNEQASRLTLSLFAGLEFCSIKTKSMKLRLVI